MKSAIVTGAGGFIGMALTKELSHAGVKVYAIDVNAEKLAAISGFPEVKVICATIGSNEADFGRIPKDTDVLFHCAFAGGFGGEALKDYNLQLKNTILAIEATDFAIKIGVKKFVFVSTVNTVELRSFIGNENFQPRYTCVYSASKLAAELIGKTLAYNGGMEFCTALVAMPYGEGNRARTLPNIVMEQLMSGVKPRLIEGRNLYDLVYIDDVVCALQSIGEQGYNFRDYYVGHRRLDTFRECVSKMRDILAPEAELGFGDYPDAPALDYSLIDLDALYNDTGFECKTDFKESIIKTAAWLKENKKD